MDGRVAVVAVERFGDAVLVDVRHELVTWEHSCAAGHDVDGVDRRRPAVRATVDAVLQAVAGEDVVVAGAAQERVEAAAPAQLVVARAAVERVGGRAADHRVVRGPGGDVLDVAVHVVAFAGSAVVGQVVSVTTCAASSG